MDNVYSDLKTFRDLNAEVPTMYELSTLDSAELVSIHKNFKEQHDRMVIYQDLKTFRELDTNVPSMYELVTLDPDELTTIHKKFKAQHVRKIISQDLDTYRENNNNEIPCTEIFNTMDLETLQSAYENYKIIE